MNMGTCLGKLIDFSWCNVNETKLDFKTNQALNFFEELKIESFINTKDHSQKHTRVSMEKKIYEKNPNTKKKQKTKKN